LVEASGERTPRKFRTQEEAEAVARELREEISEAAEKSISSALEEYELYMRIDKGNKPQSIKDTMQRLRRFFEGAPELLRSLSKMECERLYEKLRTTPFKKGKREDAPLVLLAPGTHRQILLEARSFLKWCHEDQRWIKENPLVGVKGKGKRNRGKFQLTTDELRRWTDKALELACDGDDGALGALLALLMGPRASEITKRKIRDIDDGGTVLRISDAKTEAGDRPVEIPEVLQPLLAEQMKGRPADAWLFPARISKRHPISRPHWRDWPRENIQRICKLAGLPSTTAHGMRGAHATLAVQAGVAGHLVAAQLGHTSFEKVTAKNYAKAEATQSAKARAAMRILKGGKHGT
jgi:integrase